MAEETELADDMVMMAEYRVTRAGSQCLEKEHATSSDASLQKSQFLVDQRGIFLVALRRQQGSM